MLDVRCLWAGVPRHKIDLRDVGTFAIQVTSARQNALGFRNGVNVAVAFKST
jgi:hypothetical protein